MNTPAKSSDTSTSTDNAPNVSIAVIFHSNYGHTKRVAEAIVQGAHQQLPEAQAKVVDVYDVDWDYLDQADLLVFGSAVYMGSVTAEEVDVDVGVEVEVEGEGEWKPAREKVKWWRRERALQ